MKAALVILQLGVAAIAAQNAGVPARKPEVNESVRPYIYSERHSNVKEIDFRNFTFPLLVRDRHIRLRNGKYEKQEEYGGEDVTLSWVKFLPDGKTAVAALSWTSCGGSCTSDGWILVFAVRDSHPVISQKLWFDLQAPGTGSRLNNDGKQLTITARGEGGAHCCPETLDIAHYSWNGKKYVLNSWEQKALPKTQ